jgi:uncharacterized protein YlzI (FlbEa/FlbD family)
MIHECNITQFSGTLIKTFVTKPCKNQFIQSKSHLFNPNHIYSIQITFIQSRSHLINPDHIYSIQITFIQSKSHLSNPNHIYSIQITFIQSKSYLFNPNHIYSIQITFLTQPVHATPLISVWSLIKQLYLLCLLLQLLPCNAVHPISCYGLQLRVCIKIN